jgi:hypothetical protein
MKGKEPSLRRRLANKVEVLCEMKRRGIWLADASLTALYPPSGTNGKKPPADAMRQAVMTSWRHFWAPFLSCRRPRYVVVIGKMVHDWLEEELRKAYGWDFTWIYQPAAFLTNAKKEADLTKLRRICDEYAPRPGRATEGDQSLCLRGEPSSFRRPDRR